MYGVFSENLRGGVNKGRLQQMQKTVLTGSAKKLSLHFCDLFL